MSYYLIQQIESEPNITVRTCTEVVRHVGEDDHLRTAEPDRQPDRGDRGRHLRAAVHASSAPTPRTDWLEGVLARDDHGFILTGPDLRNVCGWTLDRPPHHLETSVPGVFVAGDVRSESAKRVAAAVGEGSMAVMLVHRYLAEVMSEARHGRQVSARRAAHAVPVRGAHRRAARDAVRQRPYSGISSRARSCVEGEPATCFYVLIDGELVMSKRSGGAGHRDQPDVAARRVLRRVVERSPAGSNSVYDASVRVTKPSRFFVLDAAAFATFMKTSSRWRCTCSRDHRSAATRTRRSSTKREKLLALGTIVGRADPSAEQSRPRPPRGRSPICASGSPGMRHKLAMLADGTVHPGGAARSGAASRTQVAEQVAKSQVAAN